MVLKAIETVLEPGPRTCDRQGAAWIKKVADASAALLMAV